MENKPASGVVAESGVTRAAGSPARLEITIDEHSEHNFWAGLAMQVEEGGVFFATYQPMRIGTVVDMALALPDGKEPITVAGVVRWTRPHLEGSDGAAGIGIKFLDLSSDACPRVEEFARARAPMVFELDDPPIRRRGKAA